MVTTDGYCTTTLPVVSPDGPIIDIHMVLTNYALPILVNVSVKIYCTYVPGWSTSTVEVPVYVYSTDQYITYST